MNLINSNRLRVTVRRDVLGHRLSCGKYMSGDHAKPRLETNVILSGFGVTVHIKWRPDGKYGPTVRSRL
jgi:hypothetical protein